MFKSGDKVKISNPDSKMDHYKDLEGIISEVDLTLPYPIMVDFFHLDEFIAFKIEEVTLVN